MLVIIQSVQIADASGRRPQFWPGIEQAEVLGRFGVRMCLDYGELGRKLERESAVESNGVRVDNRDAQLPSGRAEGIQRRASHRTGYQDQFVLREELWIL